MTVLGGMLFTCAVMAIAGLCGLGFWVLSRPPVLVGMRAPWPAPHYQRMLDDANRAWAAAQPRQSWAPPVVREIGTWVASSGNRYAVEPGAAGMVLIEPASERVS